MLNKEFKEFTDTSNDQPLNSTKSGPNLNEQIFSSEQINYGRLLFEQLGEVVESNSQSSKMNNFIDQFSFDQTNFNLINQETNSNQESDNDSVKSLAEYNRSETNSVQLVFEKDQNNNVLFDSSKETNNLKSKNLKSNSLKSKRNCKETLLIDLNSTSSTVPKTNDDNSNLNLDDELSIISNSNDHTDNFNFSLNLPNQNNVHVQPTYYDSQSNINQNNSSPKINQRELQNDLDTFNDVDRTTVLQNLLRYNRESSANQNNQTINNQVNTNLNTPNLPSSSSSTNGMFLKYDIQMYN